jgi:large subunit ribosomal protein L29
MKASEIRKLDTDILVKEIQSKKKELFDLRFQAAIGQLSDTAKLSLLKKDIARMYTIITERERGING